MMSTPSLRQLGFGASALELVWVWTRMSPLPKEGTSDSILPVVRGFWYRACAVLGGAAAPVSHDTLISKLGEKGWSNIRVWDSPPADWPGSEFRSGDQVLYVEALRVNLGEELLTKDSFSVGPVTAFSYQIPEAFVWMQQPKGTPPPGKCPPQTLAKPSSIILPVIGGFVGGAAVALLGSFAYKKLFRRAS